MEFQLIHLKTLMQGLLGHGNCQDLAENDEFEKTQLHCELNDTSSPSKSPNSPDSPYMVSSETQRFRHKCVTCNACLSAHILYPTYFLCQRVSGDNLAQH